LWSHVDVNVPLQVVDAPVLRKIVGLHPALESLEREGVLRYPEILFFDDDRVSAAHGDFFLLKDTHAAWICQALREGYSYRRRLNARKNSSATFEGLPTSAPAPSSGSQSAGR